jgi:hypothetical protein
VRGWGGGRAGRGAAAQSSTTTVGWSSAAIARSSTMAWSSVARGLAAELNDGGDAGALELNNRPSSHHLRRFGIQEAAEFSSGNDTRISLGLLQIGDGVPDPRSPSG